MTEVAALGLRVTGVTDIDSASSSLDRFTKSSKSADQASGRLTTESRNTSKSLADVAREGDKSSASMSKLAGAAKLAAGAFAGIKLTTLISDITMANSRFEQLGLVMGVVGRNASLSQDQVNAYAKEVEAMGISMTESRQTIIRMTQAQMDLSKASELARLAQDAAVIANTNSSDALGRLIYGLQSGQVEILRNMGLNVNFAASYSKLAAEMGVTTDQLSEVDKVQARTNAVMEAGIGIAGAYDASMQNAGKQLGSTTRYLQDLGVMWGEVFSEAARDAIFGYSDALKGMHNTTKQMREDGTLKEISEAIGTLARGLVTAAKVAGTFAIAMYAIPALQSAWTLALAAKTTALKLFTAQVATATGALGLLQRSLMVVASAFAGWEIGTYLRNEFEVVEKAGIALMGGLHTIAVTIAGEFAIMGERVKFALTNPFDFARGVVADFFGWIAGLGASALKLIGFEDLAAGIDTEFKGIRGAVASEHAAMLKEMRDTTQSEVAGINDIYAEMFADVGRSSSQAAKTVETLNSETETLNNTVTELSAAQKALTTAFEQTLANYHKQLNLAEDATLQEQLLYEIQHGRLQGLLPAQAKMLEGMARELDMRNKLAQAEADQKEINRERDDIARQLMTEEESILTSYSRRRDIVLAATFENEQARTELLLRLEEERNEALIEANGSYWERWLLAAEENMLSFDDLSKTVVDNFTTSFGNAFESMILDSENLGDAMRNMAQGMVRAVVNAIGQMIAQWLAYQAVQMLVGKSSQTSAVAAMTANAEATSLQAGLAAFASTAAIPIVGPAAAPAAMSAALGVTQPMVGAVAASASAGLAGFQRGGYTGSMGVDEVAGVVHGREYVFDAASTARIGVDNLEAMRTGKALPSAGAIPSQSGSKPAAPSPVVVNLFEDSSRGGDVEQRQREDGSMEVNVFVADIMSNGPRARAMQQAFGLRRQGR